MSFRQQAIDAAVMPDARRASRCRRVCLVLKREWLHLLPPTIYFAVGFNLITFSLHLVVAQYIVHASNFLLVTTAALVVGKAVLVADKMPFLRRFDTEPLLYPILFKTVVYCLFVFVARLLEANIRYAIEHGGIGGIGMFLVEHFSWHRFAFIQIWIFVLFLIYVTASELNILFGQGELWRILTRRSSTTLKLTRRRRIRALTRLGRLTAGHDIGEIADPSNEVHHQIIRLIVDLAASSDDRPR
jgi:hypothetical protein